jgi:hypothetical protein
VCAFVGSPDVGMLHTAMVTRVGAVSAMDMEKRAYASAIVNELLCFFEAVQQQPQVLLTSGIPEKLASTMAVFDEHAGIFPYDRSVILPEDAVFSVSPAEFIKAAEDLVPLCGQFYSVSQLSSLPPERFGILGSDTVDMIKDAQGNTDAGMLGDVLRSLPADDQEKLLRYLSGR